MKTAASSQLFETDSGAVVAFLGPWGSRGVFLHRPDKDWEFFPSGSLGHDSFHQQVYRNHRADSITVADLKARGIPAPPPEPDASMQFMKWEDNFEAEVPFGKIPRKLRARLTKSNTPQTVFLVLSEDIYETGLGDGKFLYPDAAFWTKAGARRYIAAQPPAIRTEGGVTHYGYKYTMKAIKIYPDRERKFLRADLKVGPYEHYSLPDMLRLAACRT